MIVALSADDFSLFQPSLERIHLRRGTILAEPDEAFDFFYFPEQAVISVLASVGECPTVELGLIGAESVTNMTGLFGCDRTAHHELVELRSGSALRISRRAFVANCQRSPAAKAIFMRSALAFSMLMARALVINQQHRFDVRLARWLLMLVDRIGLEGVELTHGYIAAKLGVRRATVTDAIHRLEGAGAIRNVPGRITMRDREELESCAGRSYGTLERTLHKRIAVAPTQWGRTPADPMISRPGETGTLDIAADWRDAAQSPPVMPSANRPRVSADM